MKYIFMLVFLQISFCIQGASSLLSSRAGLTARGRMVPSILPLLSSHSRKFTGLPSGKIPRSPLLQGEKGFLDKKSLLSDPKWPTVDTVFSKPMAELVKRAGRSSQDVVLEVADPTKILYNLYMLKFDINSARLLGSAAPIVAGIKEPRIFKKINSQWPYYPAGPFPEGWINEARYAGAVYQYPEGAKATRKKWDREGEEEPLLPLARDVSDNQRALKSEVQLGDRRLVKDVAHEAIGVLHQKMPLAPVMIDRLDHYIEEAKKLLENASQKLKAFEAQHGYALPMSRILNPFYFRANYRIWVNRKNLEREEQELEQYLRLLEAVKTHNPRMAASSE